MKKIICLVLALVLCTALAIPAFAEVTPTEIEPTKISDGKYEIFIKSSENCIIKKDCEIDNLTVNGTLTIAQNVKVKVTGTFQGMDGVLNIESGAVLTYCGDDFQNKEIMNVYGTVDISKCKNRINTLQGTINVQGTLTCGGSGYLTNYGIMNKYCSGTFNGNNRNMSSGIMNTGVHDWKNGECTLCHTKCTHENWSGGVCNNCKFVCTHGNWTGGVCDNCHYACPHGNWTEGVCDTCKYACPHESWTGNECDTCHFVCQHSGGTTVICNCCGGVLSTTAAGSTLSEGNLAIITAVAGVAFGFLAAMVIFKKKKPALASGENTDEE